MAGEGIREEQTDETKLNRLMQQVFTPLLRGADEQRIDKAQSSIDSATVIYNGLVDDADYISKYIEQELDVEDMQRIILGLSTGKGVSQKTKLENTASAVFPVIDDLVKIKGMIDVLVQNLRSQFNNRFCNKWYTFNSSDTVPVLNLRVSL